MSTSAPIAVMTLHQVHAWRAALRDKLAQLDAIRTTCNGCRHLQAGRCEHFQATPPPEFQQQADACEAWQWDGIPF